MTLKLLSITPDKAQLSQTMKLQLTTLQRTNPVILDKDTSPALDRKKFSNIPAISGQIDRFTDSMLLVAADLKPWRDSTPPIHFKLQGIHIDISRMNNVSGKTLLLPKPKPILNKRRNEALEQSPTMKKPRLADSDILENDSPIYEQMIMKPPVYRSSHQQMNFKADVTSRKPPDYPMVHQTMASSSGGLLVNIQKNV